MRSVSGCVGTELGLLEVERTLEQHDRLVPLTGIPEGQGEILRAGEAIRMFTSELRRPGCQRSLEERYGEVPPAGGLVGQCERVLAGECLGIIGAEFGFPKIQCASS